MRKDRRPAKISEPFTEEIYVRKQLCKRFDAARRHPIVWVVGPPGSGKTAAVASYLRTRRIPGLWYRIDSGESDAADLFHYLGLAAVHAVGVRKARLPIRTSPSAPLPPFARHYFETLFHGLAPRSAIVFDDAHEAAPGSTWSEALQIGLSAIPSGMTAIFTSRNEPPAAFARRLAAREVEVVGWNDLRLSFEDASGIAKLRRSSARPLGTDDLHRLHELAGGWAAGLVLLLASQHRDDGAMRMGTKRVSQEMFDYFASELFERTDAPTQRFLLQTSCLTSVSERMVERLAGSFAPNILARLRRHDFFAERDGAAEVVYRYHHLFREFLVERASHELAPADQEATRREAAALFVETGQLDQAFSLYRDIGDERAIAELVMKEAPALLAQGRRGTLGQWLDSLSDATIAGNGWLLLWQGISVLGHAPSRAADRFAGALDAFGATSDAIGARLAWAGAVHAITLEGVDFTRLDPWLARAADLPASEGPLPADVALQLATAELIALQARRPGRPETRAATDRVFEECGRATDLRERLMAGALLVMHHVFFDGDLHRAGTAIEMLREARQGQDRKADPMVRVTIRLAEAIDAWARGGDERCVAAVTDGLEIGEAAGIDVWNERLLAMGAAGALGMGDLVSARRFLAPMAVGAERGGRFGYGNYHYYASWDAFLRGDLASADRSMRVAIANADAMDFPLARVLARIAMAAIDAESGRLAEAMLHVQEARTLAEAIDNKFLLYSSLLVEADLGARAGTSDHLDLLRRGLAVAREVGCFTMFWALPTMMARLAVRAIEAGIEIDYTRELVQRRRIRPEVPPLKLESWPWPLRVYTFGGFAVRRLAGEVDARARSQRVPLKLLKAIIARGGSNVRKDRLIDTLWPDADGDAGARAFDTTLHRLRKLLGQPSAVALSGGCIHLDAEIVWTDVWAIEAIFAGIDQTLEDGVDAAVALVERALSLYGGSFLVDEGDEPWLLASRGRLHDRLSSGVLRVGTKLEEMGDPDRAGALYQRALIADDAAEAVYQRLMACHLRAGRELEVQGVYKQCRERLAALGTEPSATTRALAVRHR